MQLIIISLFCYYYYFTTTSLLLLFLFYIYHIPIMSALKKVSEYSHEYSKMIENATMANLVDIISLISNNNDNESITKTLLYEFITKVASFENSPFEIILPYILNIAKNMESSASLLFYILGYLKNKKDEHLRLRIFDCLNKTGFTLNSVIDLLNKQETHNLVSELLLMNKVEIDDFIRAAVKITTPMAVKNISYIFPSLPIHYFINYNSFMFLFENESYSLRCAFLEIIENLILYFKEQNNLESVKCLTIILRERLVDINFYVRTRALGIIADLFRRECILKEQRNSMISEIIGRVKDKTVVVRKKSVNILGQILINHPFKNREDLSQNVENIENIPKNNSINSNLKNSDKLLIKQMEEDFNIFIDLMESALVSITELLEINLKTDIVEIGTFIKIAYILKLKGSAESLKKLLGLVFSKDKQVVVDIFKEIISRRNEVIFEFIGDRAFEETLRYLQIDEKLLYRSFYAGIKRYEILSILHKAGCRISEANGLTLLTEATSVLFGSQDENEVSENIKIYNRALQICQKLRGRVPHNHDILKLAAKNLVKMIFYERGVIKNTVELIYSISQNPEKNCEKLLKNLCLTQSKIKIIDCMGWVALNEYYMLERLEKNLISNSNSGKNIENSGRKCIENNIRKSIENNKEFNKDYRNNSLVIEELRERRKSIEEGRRLSIGAKISLKVDGLQENMESKTEEEISDFFFYLRERAILYSSESMLSQFIPVLNSCLNNNDGNNNNLNSNINDTNNNTIDANNDIAITAYSTMNRLMLTSSIFFNEYKQIFLDSLYHTSSIIRNNAVIAFHDLIIFYNSELDSSVLFSLLSDQSVNKNVILVIYSLLHKCIIRIKGNSVAMINMLDDVNIGDIVKSIVRAFSGNNNVMSVIFYESFLSDVNISHLKYLCNYVSKNIQESLFIKCLGSGVSAERIKCVYNSFELSEKFISENSFRDELKAIMDEQSNK